MTCNLLVVTKGHPYDHNAFHGLIDAIPEVVATFVEHPAAQAVLRPENLSGYDAVLFYDMQGIPMGPDGLARSEEHTSELQSQ